MNRRKLPLPQEPHYFNRGVHYCELCDGHTYQDKVISVMGGGNAAVDAANFLTKYASHLYLIHRSQLRADKSSQDALYANPKVTVMLETEITHLNGEDPDGASRRQPERRCGIGRRVLGAVPVERGKILMLFEDADRRVVHGSRP